MEKKDFPVPGVEGRKYLRKLKREKRFFPYRLRNRASRVRAGYLNQSLIEPKTFWFNKKPAGSLLIIKKQSC